MISISHWGLITVDKQWQTIRFKSCVICGVSFVPSGIGCGTRKTCSDLHSKELRQKKDREQHKRSYAKNPAVRERQLNYNRKRMADPAIREHKRKYDLEHRIKTGRKAKIKSCAICGASLHDLDPNRKTCLFCKRKYKNLWNREWLQKRYTDPEFRERKRQYNREYYQWRIENDPEYLERILKRNLEQAEHYRKRYADDPAYRKLILNKNREFYNNNYANDQAFLEYKRECNRKRKEEERADPAGRLKLQDLSRQSYIKRRTIILAARAILKSYYESLESSPETPQANNPIANDKKRKKKYERKIRSIMIAYKALKSHYQQTGEDND